MKKCRRCTKTATFHVTEVHADTAVAIHLCDSCAREYLEKTDSPEQEALTDLNAKLDELIAETDDSSASCPDCGTTFHEFRESGRLGCAQDYTEFLAELLPLLENIHEDTSHAGKRPGGSVIGTVEQARLVQLRKQQQQAILEEDYESAAALRDEIAALETELLGKPASEAKGKQKPD
ncbi:MAG: UvrB/UvrC motif-containing protein [Planctomycetaceae bacterium]|jgi:protein arginine kinase activator